MEVNPRIPNCSRSVIATAVTRFAPGAAAHVSLTVARIAEARTVAWNVAASLAAQSLLTSFPLSVKEGRVVGTPSGTTTTTVTRSSSQSTGTKVNRTGLQSEGLRELPAGLLATTLNCLE